MMDYLGVIYIQFDFTATPNDPRLACVLKLQAKITPATPEITGQKPFGVYPQPDARLDYEHWVEEIEMKNGAIWGGEPGIEWYRRFNLATKDAYGRDITWTYALIYVAIDDPGVRTHKITPDGTDVTLVYVTEDYPGWRNAQGGHILALEATNA
jgi:hypothetical protein